MNTLTGPKTELLQNDYQQALKLARAAWGYESRAYPLMSNRPETMSSTVSCSISRC